MACRLIGKTLAFEAGFTGSIPVGPTILTTVFNKIKIFSKTATFCLTNTNSYVIFISMEDCPCVYSIISPSGTVYIGKTERKFSKRWKAHKHEAKHGSQLPFHSAIRKYGANSFQIVLFPVNNNVLSLLERLMIVTCRNYNIPLYNCTDGGEGFYGVSHYGVKQSRNISGYAGIYKDGKWWRAQTTINGKIKHLGNYTSKQEAIDIRHEVDEIVYAGQFLAEYGDKFLTSKD